MKREFLLELKVGGESLPKEVIDAIMAQNGRDIQKIRTEFADYEELKTRLEAAEQAAQVAKDAKEWEEKYNRAAAEHEKQLAKLQFSHRLEQAIGKAGGRNTKAITALLDVEALEASEDQPAAMEKALEELKLDSGYLFGSDTPPLYAWGTGAWQGAKETRPTTLAGALREKFERKY